MEFYYKRKVNDSIFKIRLNDQARPEDLDSFLDMLAKGECSRSTEAEFIMTYNDVLSFEILSTSREVVIGTLTTGRIKESDIKLTRIK